VRRYRPLLAPLSNYSVVNSSGKSVRDQLGFSGSISCFVAGSGAYFRLRVKIFVVLSLYCK